MSEWGTGIFVINWSYRRGVLFELVTSCGKYVFICASVLHSFAFKCFMHCEQLSSMAFVI